MFCGVGSINYMVKIKRVTAAIYAVVRVFLFSNMIIFDFRKFRGNIAECCGAWFLHTGGGIIVCG